MLPSNLNISMGKAKGYNNKIFVSNTDMIVGNGLIAYHFLVENKWHHYYSQSVVPWRMH